MYQWKADLSACGTHTDTGPLLQNNLLNEFESLRGQNSGAKELATGACASQSLTELVRVRMLHCVWLNGADLGPWTLSAGFRWHCRHWASFAVNVVT